MQNKFKSPIKKAQAGMGNNVLQGLAGIGNNLKKADPRIQQIKRQEAMLLPNISPLPTDFKGLMSSRPANENVQPTYGASQADAYKKKLEEGDAGFDYYKHYMTKGNGDEKFGAVVGNWIKNRRQKKEFKKLQEQDAENRYQAEQKAKIQSAVNKGLNIKRKEDADLVTKEFRNRNDNKWREIIIGDLNNPATQNVINKLDSNGNVPGTNVTPAQTIADKTESVTPQAIASANAPLKSSVNKNNKLIAEQNKINKKLQNMPKMGEKPKNTAVERLQEKTKYGFTPAPGYVPNQGVFGRTTREQEDVTSGILGTAAAFAPFGKAFRAIGGLFKGGSKAAPVVAKQVTKQLPAGSAVKQLPAGKPIKVAKDVYQKAAQATKGTPAPTGVRPPLPNMTPKVLPGRTSGNLPSKVQTSVAKNTGTSVKNTTTNATTNANKRLASPGLPGKGGSTTNSTANTVRNTVSNLPKDGKKAARILQDKIVAARAAKDRASVQRYMKELKEIITKYPDAMQSFQAGGSTSMRSNLFNYYYNNM